MNPFAIVLLIVVLVGVGRLVLGARARKRYCSDGGCVALAIRLEKKPRGGGWRHGVARYAGNRLEWRSQHSLGSEPQLVLDRISLTVHERHPVRSKDDMALGKQCEVLECRHQGEEITLGMLGTAADDFVRWVNSIEL